MSEDAEARRAFLRDPKAESELRTAWMGPVLLIQRLGGPFSPAAGAQFVASFNKGPLLSQETVFPLMRCYLGFSARRGLLLEMNSRNFLSYLTKIPSPLPHNPHTEGLTRNERLVQHDVRTNVPCSSCCTHRVNLISTR